MKTKLGALTATILATAFLPACSTKPKTLPSGYLQIPASDQLLSDPRFPHSQVYIKDGVNFINYSKFIVEPVEIYRASDASWKEVDESTKQEIALFMRDELVRVLDPGFGIAKQAGPGVLRLKFTLVDMELTRSQLSSPPLAPVGLAMNLGKDAAGIKGSFMGSVTLAGELIDAKSDEVLASFLTRASPNALDFSASATQIAAIRKAVTETAEKFRLTMDRAHAIK